MMVLWKMKTRMQFDIDDEFEDIEEEEFEENDESDSDGV
jgi:hypothetical protein